MQDNLTDWSPNTMMIRPQRSIQFEWSSKPQRPQARVHMRQIPCVARSNSAFSLVKANPPKIKTLTFSDIFLDQKNEYALRILRFCDVGTTPLARTWLADVGLHPRSGERASEIDIARILSDTEESICFSFRYLVFIFVLDCRHKACKALIERLLWAW